MDTEFAEVKNSFLIHLKTAATSLRRASIGIGGMITVSVLGSGWFAAAILPCVAQLVTFESDKVWSDIALGHMFFFHQVHKNNNSYFITVKYINKCRSELRDSCE